MCQIFKFHVIKGTRLTYCLKLLYLLSRVGVGVASVVLGLSAWSLIASSSRMTECPPVRSKPVPASSAGGESSGSGSDPAGGAGCNAESCPWHYVVSDIANRLHLLEMAFKEQVRC